jgi:hypothetical protein
MASKKASAGNRAQQFLTGFGTAGGPVGSPGLLGFGAQDLVQQIQSGLSDQYAALRAAGGQVGVGSPNAPQPSMPQDLDAAYLKLNLPGSPLPQNALLAPQFIDAAQYAQDNIVASEQYAMSQYMPPTGQLPIVVQPPTPRKKGSR